MQGGGQRLALLPNRTLLLLSEITASTSRYDGGESDDAALIRLLADPLLLRDHLTEGGGNEARGAGLVHRLGEKLLSEFSFSDRVPILSTRAESHHYRKVTPSIADSLQPEPFVVTGEDRALALENSTGSCREAEDRQPVGGAIFPEAIFEFSFQLFLIVLSMVGLVVVLVY